MWHYTVFYTLLLLKTNHFVENKNPRRRIILKTSDYFSMMHTIAKDTGVDFITYFAVPDPSKDEMSMSPSSVVHLQGPLGVLQVKPLHFWRKICINKNEITQNLIPSIFIHFTWQWDAKKGSIILYLTYDFLLYFLINNIDGDTFISLVNQSNDKQHYPFKNYSTELHFSHLPWYMYNLGVLLQSSVSWSRCFSVTWRRHVNISLQFHKHPTGGVITSQWSGNSFIIVVYDGFFLIQAEFFCPKHYYKIFSQKIII